MRFDGSGLLEKVGESLAPTPTEALNPVRPKPKARNPKSTERSIAQRQNPTTPNPQNLTLHPKPYNPLYTLNPQ